jgi:hypothetical protein
MMGKTAKTIEILENRDLVKQIYNFVKLFGIRGAARKWDTTEYIIKVIVKFYETEVKEKCQDQSN